MPSHRHQKYSRRSFLQRSTALASAGALGSSRPLPAAQAASSPASLREPRLLFNDDANLLYFAPYPMERQALANYVRLMAESGVDAFSWDVCVNGVCWYASKVGPVVGDGLDPIPDYSVYHLRNNILHLAHKQADPPAAVAEECHRYGMRMLAAFRMGLHIFSSYEPGQGQSVYHNPRANRLTDKTIHQFPPVDNVWWRKGWARPGQTLDWAHSEVRELIMAPLREIAEGYDIDGVELNFIRGNIWFDADTAVTEAPLMTAMLGQIRQVLDQAGARRREPRRLLAVRLPDDLAACRRFGLDVPAWVEQGLVDVIMPSQVHGVDFDARVEDFAKLCAGKPIRLLPTIQPGQPPFTYSATEEFARRAYTLPQLRGLVDSWYRNGATGISTFNFQHRRSDVVSCKESVAWLKELADATKIARAERHYPLYGANVSWAASEVGVRKAIPIPRFVLPALGDSAGRAKFRCKALNLAWDDLLELDLDGKPLEQVEKHFHVSRVHEGWLTGNFTTRQEGDSDVWPAYDLEGVLPGKPSPTELGVRLAKRARVSVSVTLKEIEIVIPPEGKD